MLSDEQKAAILNSWTESRPGGTEVEAYPYVMELIVAQVTLSLTRPDDAKVIQLPGAKPETRHG